MKKTALAMLFALPLLAGEIRMLGLAVEADSAVSVTGQQSQDIVAALGGGFTLNGVAYSVTNRPTITIATGTDTVARALGWYAYSPTNKPSASDIGAATLADVSAAMATGAQKLVSTDGTNLVTVGNNGVLSLWKVEQTNAWFFTTVDDITFVGETTVVKNAGMIVKMPDAAYPLVYGTNIGGIDVGVSLGEYLRADSGSIGLGLMWGVVIVPDNSPYYESSYTLVDGDGTYSGTCAIHFSPYSATNLVTRFATTNDLADYLTQTQADARIASYVFGSLTLSSPLTNALLRLTWDPTNQTLAAQEILP